MTSRADDVTDDDEVSEEQGPKALREARKRALAEKDEAVEMAAGYRTRLEEMILQGMGLDPTRGMGKAIRSAYTGDLTPESYESFAEAEFDWKRPAPAPTGEAYAINVPQARVDVATRDAYPNVPPTTDQALAEQLAGLRREGRWKEASELEIADYIRRMRPDG